MVGHEARFEGGRSVSGPRNGDLRSHARSAMGESKDFAKHSCPEEYRRRPLLRATIRCGEGPRVHRAGARPSSSKRRSRAKGCFARRRSASARRRGNDAREDRMGAAGRRLIEECREGEEAASSCRRRPAAWRSRAARSQTNARSDRGPNTRRHGRILGRWCRRRTRTRDGESSIRDAGMREEGTLTRILYAVLIGRTAIDGDTNSMRIWGAPETQRSHTPEKTGRLIEHEID